MNGTADVMVVLGTRPEVIKLAPVVQALRALPGITTSVVFTSQHREMAASVAGALGLAADHDLDVMTAGQSPSDVAARVLTALDPLLAAVSPRLVMVQGDTTSAFAAALAAFHRRIAVAHVEAGLRTATPDNPFPEEMNRRLITRIAALHFAATPANRDTLLAEHVDPASIHVTGNPVIDTLGWIVGDAEAHMPPPPVPEILGRGGRLLLLTTHRRENFGDAQREIFRAVAMIVERCTDVEVVYPVHPNPAVTAAVAEYLPDHPRIHRIAPLDYPSFVRLLAAAHLVLTDSGGLQEEAPALGKPVLVLRSSTERGELIASGGGALVGLTADAIVEATMRLLEDPAAYAAMARVRYPFGEGGAAARIAEIVARRLASTIQNEQ